MRLSNVTASFNSLFEARENPNYPGRSSYSLTLLLPKGSPECKMVEKAIADIKVADAKGKEVYFEQESFYDGDNNPKFSKYESNQGNMILRMSRAESQGAPGVFDEKAERCMDRTKFYPGCLVNVDMDIFVARKGGRRVCFGLVQVQFAGDGPRIGGGEAPPAFAPVETSDDKDFDFLD